MRRERPCINARFSMMFFNCAILLAAAAPSGTRTDESLKRAWFQAQYAVDHIAQDGYAAQNPSQHLQVSFGPAQTRLMHGDDALTLRLMGYGRDGQLQQPNPARIASTANRVEYRMGALTEWYVNEARGLEQGFTLSTRPASSGSGPLVIALEMTGTLRPSLRSSSELVLLNSVGDAVLDYGDLRAWDACGQRLTSTFAVEGDQVRLIVEDAGAVYPVTIDPTVTQILLLPSDGSSSSDFGNAVAISGNTAVVGASAEAGQTGAAYVFVLSNGTWIQQAKLTASDAVSGYIFGNSIAVDGDTAVIGAVGANTFHGAAYVFVRSGSTWSQQAKLTASDGAIGDGLGDSVAVSGNIVVAGASEVASGQGAAYVFTASGSTWTQQAKLTASDGVSGDQFGLSVSLSGTTAVAGAPGRSGRQGAAYVFVSSGTSWTQQGKLTATDGASGDRLGASVSVSGDIVLAGAPVKNCLFSCGTAQAGGFGLAYVFARSGSSWIQQAELSSSDGGGAFGGSVAVSGNTAVVGEIANVQLVGAAFVFVRSGSTWTPQTTLIASDHSIGEEFGTAVAVSGNLAVIGVPQKNNGQGVFYVFSQSGSAWTQQAEMTASDATGADNFGNAIAVSGETALIASPTKDSLRGAVYVFVRSITDGTWSQQAKLTLPGAASGTAFGEAISLSGDTAVIGASGAAYVYVRSGTTWTQQAKLIGSDTVPSDIFGFAVAVDGDTAVVTAFQADSARGAAYVFVRNGANWTQQAKLTASDAAVNDLVGRAVSLNGDTVLLGTSFQNKFQGGAYVFVRSGATWTQQAKLTASDAASGDNFGFSLSVSGDTAIVGAYNKSGAEGAAYVFVRANGNWTQQTKLLASDAKAGQVFGIAVSIDGDLAVVGANRADGHGAAYVFARSGANWSQYIKLSPADPIAVVFGNAVSISAGTVICGAPGRAAGEGAAYVFPLPTISAGGIVHAASFAHTIAPGSIASVFGTNYANANTLASSTPLPDVLSGVSISVNNTPAPLIFVGQFQANFQIPFETAPGEAAVVVTANGVASLPQTVKVTEVAPGIFITGTNQAVVLNPDLSVADGGHPAKVGSVVVMYVTGLGALDHPIATGAPASSNPLSNAKVVPTVTIGGANAVVQFAGMTPGFVGLGQINIVIPKLANGSYPVVVTQGGQASNNPVMSVTQ